MIEVDLTSRPGKTAPRFIEDLLSYCPDKLPPSGHNVLTDTPPKFFPKQQAKVMVVGRGACRHKFMLKKEQSILSKTTAEPDTLTVYKVATFCQDCRWHLDLLVDYRNGQPSGRSCPNDDYPLHHLQHLPARTMIDRSGGPDHGTEQHYFQCSYAACAVKVNAKLAPPRMTPDYLQLFTEEALKQRSEIAVKLDPIRFKDHKKFGPYDALSTLQQYIHDALHTDDPTKAKFSETNRRYLLNLGPSCTALMERVGFTLEVHEGGERTWHKPKLEKSSTPTYQDPIAVTLDDFEYEIRVLMGLTNPKAVSFFPVPAYKEFERSLGCLDYAREPSAKRKIDFTQPEHPHYASLGALADFSDDLLVFAHDRQRLCDPENAPYYFDCLKGMADGRMSETLQTRVAILTSDGELSYEVVQEAYKFFGMEADNPDDDNIIGLFKARLADTSKGHENELRDRLKVIGLARQSQKIQAVAAKTITSYEEALSWLDAAEQIADEFVVSLAAAKVSENRRDIETARLAVSIIAEERKSEQLRNWLSTGELGEVEMDEEQAWAVFNIKDRTADADFIIQAYKFNIEEESDPTKFQAALRTIGKATNNEQINNFLLNGDVAMQMGSYERPVGLENTGNFCYLNSLLQYYFCLAPMRRIVLAFWSEYGMEGSDLIVDEQGKSLKRIGGEKITRAHVEEGRKFIRELQILFRDLIVSKSSSISPNRELARLTLLPIGRRSGVINSSKSVETKKGQTLDTGEPHESGSSWQFGANLEPEKDFNEMELDSAFPNGDHVNAIADDGGSEDTLIEKLPSYEEAGDYLMINSGQEAQQEKILEDKENHAPSKEDVPIPQQDHLNGIPSKNVRQSRMNLQGIPHPDHPLEQPGFPEVMNGVEPPVVQPQPAIPDRPPPVPPRPKSLSNQHAGNDELNLRNQQDVTEAMENFMYQVEYCMKPDDHGLGEDGEQHDEIKTIFYGKMKTTTTKPGCKASSKTSYFLDLKINVVGGPRGIYEALDQVFHLEDVEVDNVISKQYSSITDAPRILQIQVQRAQYDSEKQKSYKSEAHLRMEDVIYLDRFMDPQNSSELALRQESWAIRAELAELDARRMRFNNDPDTSMNAMDLMRITRDYVDHHQRFTNGDTALLNIDPTIKDALEARMEELNSEGIRMANNLLSRYALKYQAIKANSVFSSLVDLVAAIQDRTERMDHLFDGMQRHKYRLFAVCFHRGSASFGHYWITIYDHKMGIWRKYNDSSVTTIDRREVFEQADVNPATPYFLAYVRDDIADQVVDPLCRGSNIEFDESGNMIVVDQPE